MDHGVLNIPRGNIDAQIDRYKAAQARQQTADRRTRAEKLAEDRITAKALIAAASAERIADLAVKCGVTRSVLLKQIKSDAHWLPRTVIGIFQPRYVAV